MIPPHFEAERFRYFILAAQRLGQRQMNEYMKAIDLTPSQAEVISVLNIWQPISLKNLGALLICETGSPSRLLDRMAEDGLVEKAVNPDDARFVLLRLTAQGMAKAELVKAFEEQLYTDLENLFTHEEMASVSAALEKLLCHYPIADTLRKRNLASPQETNT